MPNILEFATQDVPSGTESLPLGLTQGTETNLTSIWLTATSSIDQLLFAGNIGWSVQFLNQTVTPQFTFRIRVGGATPSDPIAFQTTDSEIFPGNTGLIMQTFFNTSFFHTQAADPSNIGNALQYFLTVSYTGLGNVAITGPVNLTGQVIG